MLRSMVISETRLLERAARGLRGDGEKRICFPSWWLRGIRSTPQSLAGQGCLAVGREEMRCIAAAGMLDADKAERTAVSEKGTIKSTFLPEALEAALHDLGLLLARRTSARIDLHWLRDRFDSGALDLDPMACQCHRRSAPWPASN